MAIRRTNQEWQTLFEHYEMSDLTQRAFCDQHGLSLSTFFSKRRQLKTATQSAPVGFVRAEIVETTTKYKSTQAETSSMTLLVKDIELSIPQGTPANYLAELIGALS